MVWCVEEEYSMQHALDNEGERKRKRKRKEKGVLSFPWSDPHRVRRGGGGIWDLRVSDEHTHTHTQAKHKVEKKRTTAEQFALEAATAAAQLISNTILLLIANGCFRHWLLLLHERSNLYSYKLNAKAGRQQDSHPSSHSQNLNCGGLLGWSEEEEHHGN